MQVECAALRLQLQLSKTKQKTERGHLYNERVIVHSYHGAKTGDS